MRSFLFFLGAVACLVALPAALCLDAPQAAADEVLKPTKAYSAFLKETRRLSPEEQKERAEAYIAAWEGTGQKATGAQRYALAQFQQVAERFKDAAIGFRTVMQDSEVKPRTRDYAASAEAGVMLFAETRQALGQAGVDEAVARLEKYADGMTSDSQQRTQAKLRSALARLHSLAGRLEKATNLRMQVIESDSSQLDQLLRPLVWDLRQATHAMSGYAAMQARAKEVMQTLRDIQSQKVGATKKKLASMVDKLRAAMPDALDAEGRLKKDNPREMNAAERAVYSAQRSHDNAVELMAAVAAYEKTFALLGSAPPALQVDKAYGDVGKLEDLKGKVVVMDFWLTSGQRSNFGVMRDLMRSYGEKAFTVLGITATSHVVYETRFDIDEDFRHKVVQGQRKQYAARLATELDPPDEGNAIYPEDRYTEIEMRVIDRFIQQHELKWPHLMVLETQPEDHFALEGWPHVVVLDKAGRIRYIEPATLTRDKKELVASLRKVIEDLLAE